MLVKGATYHAKDKDAAITILNHAHISSASPYIYLQFWKYTEKTIWQKRYVTTMLTTSVDQINSDTRRPTPTLA